MAWGCDVVTQKTPTTNSEVESVLVPKVQALMESLDQVKKYKKLSNSIIDLVLIIVASVAVAAAIDLAGYFYLLLYANIGSSASGFFYITPPEFFISIVVVIAGVLIGVLIVDRNVKNVSTGDWKKSLEQDKSVPAALNILSSLDWGSAFKDIQYSKLGFLLYGFLKVIGYWLFFSFLLLLFDGFFLFDWLHVSINSEALSILSLVIALAVSWGDLRGRFNQSWSLDTLLWELRWFDSEFRRAESEFTKEA